MTRTRPLFVAALALLISAAAFAAKQPKLKSSDCLACHNDPTLTKDLGGKPVSLAVSEEHFKKSVHGIFECTDCHSDVTTAPHETAPKPVSCSQCHADEQQAYSHSLHATAIKNGDSQAATCVGCHGNIHEVLPSSDPNSRTFRANVPKTCGTCHGVNFVMEASGTGLSTQPFYSYQQSVHGKAVAAGSVSAAVCTDCHGTHEILPPRDPKSPIFKFNVPNTCAKCHGPVAAEYKESIHGVAVARGNWQAPVCTDCHGIHLIKAKIDPNSPVAAQALARTTCAQCHESVRMSQEFGVAARRASTYLASYHGLASQMGSTIVANCASCHGVHNILPSSNPKSTINAANLQNTCGKCHNGATRKFIAGKVHLDVPLSADTGSTAIRWVRRFYLWMIFLTIGGMLAHNFLVWRKKLLKARGAHPRTVLRMNFAQRVQHLTLLLSFGTLVLTGFALKYPESWLGMIFSEQLRRIGHRIAGVVLIAAGLYHLYYVTAKRDGRKLVWDLRPVKRDIYDVLGTLRYYLGWSPAKPQYARFNYGEKAEYWAVVWGTIVMGVTGLMVWFKLGVGIFVPRWIIDVALAVHFYEAILATLAIVVWHFYNVIFDPDVYPLNWSFWDGRMSVEHFQEEHSLEWKQLTAGREESTPAAIQPDKPAEESRRPPAEEPETVGSRDSRE